MRLFILEMWHTFVNEYERRKRSLQTGTLYEWFRQLVQDRCMKEREVKFYANQLNISDKYLNVISKIENDSYWVMGEYFLSREVGDANGVFMIIFKNILGSWKIVADMSCG